MRNSRTNKHQIVSFDDHRIALGVEAARARECGEEKPVSRPMLPPNPEAGRVVPSPSKQALHDRQQSMNVVRIRILAFVSHSALIIAEIHKFSAVKRMDAKRKNLYIICEKHSVTPEKGKQSP